MILYPFLSKITLMTTYIISTSKAQYLIKKIKEKQIKAVFPKENKRGERQFLDKEIYVKIPEAERLKNKRVVILHSGAPDPNEGIIELELILEILKDYDIRPEVFFSYFPYSRQDKVFEKGETNAALSLIKKLITYYLVKKIYVIDPHFGKRAWINKYPIKAISVVEEMIERAKKDFKEDILFMSPDKGGKRRTGINGLKKKRINDCKIKISSKEIDLKGKTIAVVDDIIGSGATLIKFYDFAKKCKAKKVIALITHGVISEGIKEIKKKYSKLYLTNTINRKEANIDISQIIVRNILD